ncbi:MAG: hypothetical protein ACI4SR_00465 [Faecalibacillus sp.]
MIENDKDKMIDHINQLTDQNSPIFKMIGYRLHDYDCINELKEYLGYKMSIAGFIIILLVNCLLLVDIVYIYLSQYLLIFKCVFICVLLFVDYILIKKYKNFLLLSYSYKILYSRIQKVPEDILKQTYYKIISKGKV